tara:strand:+ start:1108 stop:1857 length:750 start_codon:yes stop_codon:yes gene_type:complete
MSVMMTRKQWLRKLPLLRALLLDWSGCSGYRLQLLLRCTFLYASLLYRTHTHTQPSSRALTHVNSPPPNTHTHSFCSAPAAAAKEEKGPAAAEEGDSAAAAPAETKEAEEESKEEKPDLLAIIASSKKQTIASFDEWQTRFAGEWTELWAAREAHRSSVEQLAAVACDAGLATAQSASKMAEDLTNAKTFDAEIAKLIAAAEKQKAAEEKAAAAAKAAEEKAAAAAVKEAEKKAAADAKAAAKEAKKKK